MGDPGENHSHWSVCCPIALELKLLGPGVSSGSVSRGGFRTVENRVRGVRFWSVEADGISFKILTGLQRCELASLVWNLDKKGGVACTIVVCLS